MTDTEALVLADWILQTTAAAELALDAIARGELPAGWAETADDLADTQALFCGPSAQWWGRVVSEGDVAALARLRELVAAGSVGDEARALAAGLRAGLDRAPPRAA